MPRILLCLALAAPVCTLSCRGALAEPSPDVAAQQKAIVFGWAEQTVKSAEETTALSLLEKGFRVHGISSDSQTDFTDTTRWDSVSCCFRTASMEHFYPTGDGISMDYEAIFPPGLELSSSGVVEYVLGGQDDVVAATRKGVGEDEMPVLLDFQHILSRVSVSISYQVPGIEYLVDRISITSPESGCYIFSDLSWENLSGRRESIMEESEPVSVFPGKTTITVAWKTFRDGITTGDYCKSVEIDAIMGRHSIVGLVLSDDQSSECGFTVEIAPWEEKETDITFN